MSPICRRAELDLDLEDAAAGTDQVRHRFPDIVLVQEHLSVGFRIEEGPIDADDHVTGTDTGTVGS